MECRLVADIGDDPTIVTLSATKESIKLFFADNPAIVLQREDLPQVAIVALKEFIA
jgi:hypothetical protein